MFIAMKYLAVKCNIFNQKKKISVDSLWVSMSQFAVFAQWCPVGHREFVHSVQEPTSEENKNCDDWIIYQIRSIYILLFSFVLHRSDERWKRKPSMWNGNHYWHWVHEQDEFINFKQRMCWFIWLYSSPNSIFSKQGTFALDLFFLFFFSFDIGKQKSFLESFYCLRPPISWNLGICFMRKFRFMINFISFCFCSRFFLRFIIEIGKMGFFLFHHPHIMV